MVEMQREKKGSVQMKDYRLFLMVILTVSVILSACGNTSDKPNTTADDQAQNSDSTEETNDEAMNEDSTGNDSNNNLNENVDAPTKNASSLKEEYLQKLHDTKKETDAMEPIDNTTFALKKVEGDRHDIWDGLLNEIYAVLEKQLPAEEMEQLRKEQREWIVHRDATAKEASLKYEGGTMEQLEYVAVANNLTVERCFELVEEYLK